ncbi:zinc ABC transporter ATP-binding protein AztA [Methylocapsa palsarum]|uniref:Zinc/manganese transport system ATP-binding protein n=1 Tax=Methylocapsa palsarum TaxID=1612308 RepID=A0A1I4BG20_9HYPH|nr:zinc ABC transporter ATP-binding protein AztA [Methylocapsa palsarum]SFK66931.1 zinc/manganese transport system ATP-binding protein [Methylocapsa palsarum]
MTQEMNSGHAVAIAFHDLTLGYEGHPAVHHLDGEIEKGALLAICGPNGAGKSTLLKSISGALSPLSGSLSAPRRRDIAYLPQAADIDTSFPITVLDVVAMGLWTQCGPFRAISGRRLEEVRGAVSAVGLNGFEDRVISTLSGGQLQRMLFARLLIQDASVVLLDEPFAAIDANTSADLLALIARWHDEQRTVLVVSHDLDLVRDHFPQTLLLAREQVARGKTSDVLTTPNLARARSRAEAFDRGAAVCARAA